MSFDATLRAENRRHQVARFRDHFFARHRIFGGAAHGLDSFGQMRAVRQRYLDDGLASRQVTLEFGIGNELDFGALFQRPRDPACAPCRARL